MAQGSGIVSLAAGGLGGVAGGGGHGVGVVRLAGVRHVSHVAGAAVHGVAHSLDTAVWTTNIFSLSSIFISCHKYF